MGLSIPIAGKIKPLIIVKIDGRVLVYVNSCPHIGTPLDLRPGYFLNHDKQKIICSTHGALFNINTGRCISGPCKDAFLEAVPIRIVENDVFSIAN